MISIHDNEVISYQVDLRNHKIILYTEASNNSEEVAVLFGDVFAHQFENQIEGSIILDIKKKGLNLFFKENKELLETQKNYGWPTIYENTDELSRRLIKEGYLYYVILSSYGLSGWVVAKQFDVIRTSEKE